MTIQRDRRIARTNYIISELKKVADGKKKKDFDLENFVSRVMVSFMVSRRVALEDTRAVMNVLGL